MHAVAVRVCHCVPRRMHDLVTDGCKADIFRRFRLVCVGVADLTVKEPAVDSDKRVFKLTVVV